VYIFVTVLHVSVSTNIDFILSFMVLFAISDSLHILMIWSVANNKLKTGSTRDVTEVMYWYSPGYT
jgi:hypothetical protein